MPHELNFIVICYQFYLDLQLKQDNETIYIYMEKANKQVRHPIVCNIMDVVHHRTWSANCDGQFLILFLAGECSQHACAGLFWHRRSSFCHF